MRLDHYRHGCRKDENNAYSTCGVMVAIMRIFIHKANMVDNKQ